MSMPFFTEKFASTLSTKDSGAYLNPSSIEDGGSVRFAILSDTPLEGVEIWFQKTGGGATKRITPEWPSVETISAFEQEVDGTLTVRDGKPAIKYCTCFFVYDYSDSKVKVFSANQKSLLEALNLLCSDPDYQDLSEWDVKINRNGKGTDTKYMVSMMPTRRSQSTVAKAVKAAWEAALDAGADLTALYLGGNPFTAQEVPF